MQILETNALSIHLPICLSIFFRCHSNVETYSKKELSIQSCLKSCYFRILQSFSCMFQTYLYLEPCISVACTCHSLQQILHDITVKCSFCLDKHSVPEGLCTWSEYRTKCRLCLSEENEAAEAL